MNEWMNNKIIPTMGKFSNNSFVKSMQTGMTAPMIATVVGSIFTIMAVPPVSATSKNAFVIAWREWSVANASWLNLGIALTINAVALYALFGFVIDYSIQKKAKPVNMVVLSKIIFLSLCATLNKGLLTLDNIGSKGLFSAIIIGWLTVNCGQWLLDHGVKIKLPATVPPNVAEPIQALFMNIIMIGGTYVVVVILGHFNLVLPNMINGIFAPLFTAGDSFWAVIISFFFIRVLWFFGLHGGNIGGAILSPFLTQTMVENISAYAKGQTPPHIFTLVFHQTWGSMGMLAICIALMIFCRSKQLRAISAIGLVPALFNIGEPITFGLPLVLNFNIVIPYLIIFPLDGGAAWLATKMGLMARTFINVPSTVPAIFKVFLSNLDWRSVVVYLVLLVIDVIIFAPFLKSYDKRLLADEKLEAVKLNRKDAGI